MITIILRRLFGTRTLKPVRVYAQQRGQPRGAPPKLTNLTMSKLSTYGMVFVLALILATAAYGQEERIIVSTSQDYHNQIHNASFESWSQGTTSIPDGWTAQATPSYLKLTDDKRAGASALKLTADASAEGISQAVTVDPNTTYTVSFYYKVDSGDALTFNVAGAGGTLVNQTSLNAASWKRKAYTFTTGPSDTSVTIKITANNATDVFYIDGAMLTKGHATPAFAEHGLTDTGNQTIYGDLAITGAVDGATMSASTSITTPSIFTSSGDLTLNPTGTNDVVMVADGGSVGIGTPGPLAQLHTTGTVRLAGVSSATQSDAVMIDLSGNLTKRTLDSIAFDGEAGTVSSVGLSAPAEFTVSGSPVTTSGTLTFTKVSQNANIVYAGPSSGGAVAPTFRTLVDDDIPDDITASNYIPTSYLDTDTTLAADSDVKVASQHAAKVYIDNAIAGLKWKASVKAATTAAGTLSSSFANGQSIDGITLATGDRILIKDQAAPAENGIYTVNASGTPTRATDADASDGSELVAAAVFIEQGLTYADTAWVCSDDSITLGTTALTFAQFSGAAVFSAGSGLTKSGTTFKLGGTLTEATTITQGDYKMLFDLTGTGDFSVDDTLYVTDTGNVGIGVIGPDTQLEVFNAGNQLKLSYDATDNTVFAVDTSGDLTITPSGTQIIISGNISATNLSGTNTGDATHAYDVVATTPITVNGGTNVDDILLGADGDLIIAMPVATTSVDGYVVQADWDSWTNHVADNTQAHSDYLLNNASDTTSGVITSAGIIVGDGQTVGATTNKWLFDDTNGDITTTGNVGIGTTSPEAELDVAGDIMIRGGLTSELLTTGAGGGYIHGGGANLLPEGRTSSFEGETTGWSPRSGASVAASTDVQHTGAYSMKISTTVTSLQWGTSSTMNDFQNADETDFVASAWVYIPTAGGIDSVKLLYRDGGTNFFTGGTTYDTPYVSTKDEWFRIVLPFKAQAVSDNGYLWFWASGVAAGEYLYIDDVQIQRGQVATEYNPIHVDIDTNNVIIEGNVGIGTTSPTEKLHVEGNLYLNGSLTGSFTIPASNISAATFGAGNFVFPDNLTVQDNVYLATVSGSVGIGTSSPESLLHVKGSSNPWLKIEADGGTSSGMTIDKGASQGGYLQFTSAGVAGVEFLHDSAEDFIINQKQAKSIKFETNDADRMIITSTGNVGIGTTSPDTLLEISKADQDNGATLRITNAFSGTGWAVGDVIGSLEFFSIDAGSGALQRVTGNIESVAANSGNYFTQTDLTFGTLVSSTLTERMRIRYDGNVGIGTTNPANTLDVNGGIDANTLNTGYGDNELYDMNQNVMTSNSPTFVNLTLTDTSEQAITFDGGHAFITVHDGLGNFNLLSGIDYDNTIVAGSGGIRMEMSDNGYLDIEIYSGADGTTGTEVASFYFDDDELNISSANLIISGTVDGRDVSVDGTKLDGIESGATADQTASEILTAIKTVDGSGSGLDADLFDGRNSDDFVDDDGDTMYGDLTMTSQNISNLKSIYFANTETADHSATEGRLMWDDSDGLLYYEDGAWRTIMTDFSTNMDEHTFTVGKLDTGSGAMELGDAAVANGDTDSIPTGDQVYDFVTGLGYATKIYVTRDLPPTVNNYVEIGKFDIANGAHNLYVAVTISQPNFNISKQYILPLQWNQTGTPWSDALPISSSGEYMDNDFALEIRVNNEVATLRLRRTSGSTAGAGIAISIEQLGSTADTFTALSNTGTSAARDVFEGTPLTQVDGYVGIGTAAPLRKLHVKGAIGLNDDSYIDTSSGYTRFLTSGNGAQPIKVGALVVSSSYGDTAPTNGAYIKGNVGIGTTSPFEKLDVRGSIFALGEGTGFLTDATGTARVGLIKYSGREGGIWRTTSQDFEIGRVNISDLPGSPTTWTTDLYVSGTGNVGIGTTSPDYKLEVDGTSDFGGTTSFADGVTGKISWGSGRFIMTSMGSYDMTLATDSFTDRMTIEASTGNVGIGVTNPTTKLHVVNSGSTHSTGVYSGPGDFLLRNTNITGANQGAMMVFGSSWNPPGQGYHAAIKGANDVWANNGAGNLQFYTAAQGGGNQLYERMRIDSYGNVGIGTTAPNALLSVNEPTNYDETYFFGEAIISGTTKTIEGTNGTVKGTLDLQAMDGYIGAGSNADLGTSITFSTNVNKYNYENPFVMAAIKAGKTSSTNGQVITNGYLGFYTSDTTDVNERMRITHAGNVGIGTTSPGQKLQVAGNIVMQSGGYLDDDTTMGEINDDWMRLNGYIELRSNTDSYGIVLRDKDTSSYFGITQVGGASYLTDASTYTNYFLKGDGANVTVRGALTALTLNTGQGANDLYDMNQNVKTTNAVTFATVNTGYGANELWDMNQHVKTTSNVQFKGLTVSGSTGYDEVSFISTTGASILWIDSAGTGGSLLYIDNAGSSGGDTQISMRIQGIRLWNLGIDNSDADKFKIATSGGTALQNGTKMTIDTSGNAWFAANVSAASFTDRTPSFEGDALTKIKKIKGKKGKIDHSTLPEFVQMKRNETIRDKDGKKIGEEEVVERNIGNMISMNVRAIQQLAEENETLRQEIAAIKKHLRK